MIFDAYIRWRHSRGFGVHSPFAYHIVTSAISPGRQYGYYGYEAIEQSDPKNSRRDARFLLRLIVALDAKRVLIPATADKALLTAVRASGAEIVSDSPDLAVVFSPDKAPALIDKGIPVLIMSASRKCDMETALPGNPFRGLILLGLRKALIIPREDMARTFYTMSF
ncbi:MAG: hypothetical protein K2K64_10490 [Muribaculaceae bacterium]|nr:hypothetical protein [Muribaculaceae bacterium]